MIRTMDNAPPSKSKTSSLSGPIQVTDGLYLSNASVASNYICLTAHRITCVISVYLENTDHHYPNFQYLHFPMSDTPDTFLFEHFEIISDKIRIVESNGGRTLLHCAAGISRSPSLCLAYLMKNNGLSLLAAHTLLKKRRPIIRPNYGFWEQLIRYEMELFGKNTVQMVNSPMGLIPDIYEEETKNMIPF
ncbi:dual specificity protein phosphatase 18 [Pelobates fuscus]|uniref:dual specificity protein phosphatase 18 n=1 Tax=Pelobates fuscus TaxID=191477 RepID=UPI002FE4D2B7